MAWPVDVSDGQVILASHINAIKNSVITWGGDVNGGGYQLLNAGRAGIGSSAAPYRMLCVAAPSQNVSLSGAGAGAASFGLGVGQTDDALIFGMSNGGAAGEINAPYAWIQAVKPGSANRALGLNINNGPYANVVMACPEGTYLDIPAGTMTFFKAEASNQLRIRVKYTTGVYKDAVLTLA